jgi:hypothetical protein
MAIDSVSSTSENVPNQDQVSVTREDDGSLSISISVDASATASADGESSSETVTEAEQAKSDVDGTDTAYPTDQAGESDVDETNDKELLTALEDLSAKLDEVIELLGGLSGDGKADEPSPMGGDTPVDTSQTGIVGSDNTKLAERLDGVAADLEEIISGLSGGELSDVSDSDMLIGEEPGEQLINAYNYMDLEGQAELIETLGSGEFGEVGVQIAEALPNAIDIDNGLPAADEIKKLMADEDIAEEILAAALPIIQEHTLYSPDMVSEANEYEVVNEEDGGEPPVRTPEDNFIIGFGEMNSEGRDEVIEVLRSGEFGEDGKKIAELLTLKEDLYQMYQNEHTVGGQMDLQSQMSDIDSEIKEILVDSGNNEDILATIEPITHGE